MEKKRYRVECPNRQCKHVAMVQPHSDRPYVRKALLAEGEPRKRVYGTAIERVQFRCPKCGTRWRVRVDQLH